MGGAGGGSATSRAILKPRTAKDPPKRKHVSLSSPPPVQRKRRIVSPKGRASTAERAYYLRQSKGNDPSIPVLPEETVRTAIHVVWHANHRPREPDFICPDGERLIPRIQRALSCPDHTMIKSVLEDSIKDYLAEGGGYNPCRGPAGRRAFKIDLVSGECLMISRALRAGLGPSLVCELVNIKRTEQYFKDTYPAEWARQIRAVGEVNAGFPNYKGSLVGNSPEFMPLDSNLFADIERLIIMHRALTYEYAAGDARRFSIGTPKQCASTVRRVWEMIPGHRIIRDCDRWQEAYVQVNKAGGKVVRGFGRVTGRRSGLQRGNPEVPTQFHADAADGVKALLDLA